MKTYFQISLKVFTVLLTVILVCIGCGKNSNSTSGSDSVSEMSQGEMSQEDMCNPAIMFTAYKPIYEASNGTKSYSFKGIKVFDANGEIKYSDEEAEQYYDYYAIHFLCACIIADKVKADAELRSYIEEHLFDVVCNLPLGESYPSNVRENVKKIYYDNKDKIMNMTLKDRRYGYLLYKYDSSFVNQIGSYWNSYLEIYRNKDSGVLIAKIDSSF